MAEYENLRVDIQAPLARVTIDRPAKLNALNGKTINELDSAFSRLNEASEVRAIILTGAGEKSFVAGADINELAKLTPIDGRDYGMRGQALFRRIELFPKPVIAAINGFALGGGLELAMACTFRIASENARLGQPEVKLGIIPGYGGSQRLPRLVTPGAAFEMLLTGEPVSATEALRLGLVNRVVPLPELLPTAEALGRKIAANAPLAIRFCLEAVRRGLEMAMDEALYLESTLFALCCTTEDMKEGTEAFLQKRQADFKGK